MKTDTTTSATIYADVAQQAEQRSRKATVGGSIPFIGSILLAFAIACTPANYAKALDQCAFEHTGDRAATIACQCDVATQYGRDCGFLHPEAGSAGPVDRVKDAGGDE